MITDLFCASVPQTITLVTVDNILWMHHNQCLNNALVDPTYSCLYLLSTLMRLSSH
jgi:hypothetical protein